MAEFVERNLEDNFYGRKKADVIFDGNNFEAKKREINREKIAREKGLPMSSIEHFIEHLELHGNRPKRRTRGGGRKINNKRL